MVVRAIVATLSLFVAAFVSCGAAAGPTASIGGTTVGVQSQGQAVNAVRDPTIGGVPMYAVSARPLTFSRGLNEAGDPYLPEIEFPSAIVTVWAAFDYSGYADGTHLNAVVRANGKDHKSFGLLCCPSADGRFEFPIERESRRPLGGAAWEVVVYAGGAEITRGGFGVRGTRGFEDDDD